MYAVFCILLYHIFYKLGALRVRCMDKIYKEIWPSLLGSCGDDVYIYYPFKITDPRSASIGNNVHINRGAFIRAEGGLIIGDNVHIAPNLTIYTINHNYAGDAIPYDNSVVKKPVTIHKNVWIGVNVTIVPGVTIGEGAIVGAGSVVSKDVPALAIVGSTPLRIIKYRAEEHYRQLDRAHMYGGVNGSLYRKGRK